MCCITVPECRSTKVFAPPTHKADFFLAFLEHETLLPCEHSPDGDIVAIGVDRGRDFQTLIEAVRDTDLRLHLHTRPDISRRMSPPNVVNHGTVSIERYREILRHAAIVAVPPHPMAYPTGQTVAMETAAAGCCIMLTDSSQIREYFHESCAVSFCHHMILFPRETPLRH